MAEAVLKGNSSNAIIISFDSKWMKALEDDLISVVFRKRGPTKIFVNQIYVYIKGPVKSIIGRLEVIKVKQLCISECIDLSSKGAIKKKELVQYATNYEKLFVFYVKPMKKANSQISYFQLRERYNFNAPQNFVILSKEGKEIIEKLGKFKK